MIGKPNDTAVGSDDDLTELVGPTSGRGTVAEELVLLSHKHPAMPDVEVGNL